MYPATSRRLWCNCIGQAALLLPCPVICCAVVCFVGVCVCVVRSCRRSERVLQPGSQHKALGWFQGGAF
jgi:hypothetical protein